MKPGHLFDHEMGETLVHAPVAGVTLEGNLNVPEDAKGMVLFAHGSGSSRFSPRNRIVAATLTDAGLGTFLVDLLTPQEERVDVQTREYRFDIPRLAERLTGLVDWLKSQEDTRELPIGLFGSSTGGGAALITAADRPDAVDAVVSRGGRPDLAGDRLPDVRAPTLLLVGEWDEPVIGMNEDAASRMRNAEVIVDVVPGATHLFEEPGKLDEVAGKAREWFIAHFSH